MPNPTSDVRGDRSDAPPRAAPGRLKQRADFLHVGKGRRWHGRAVTVQMSPRRAGQTGAGLFGDGQVRDGRAGSAAGPARFGLTLTKKVGNAVVRNRARRRLREAIRLASDLPARAGHDYVLVGRLEAIRLPFASLLGELVDAVERVHADDAPRGGGRRMKRRS